MQSLSVQRGKVGHDVPVRRSTFLFPHQTGAKLDYRWVYVAQNLQVEENVGKVENLMRWAKKAGYNGMVLADYKPSVLN